MAKADLTAQRLRELVHYDPDTGVFLRRKANGDLKPGPYGAIEKRKGYLIAAFGGIGTFRLHRLAWLYVHGKWPDGVIDHINGNPADNRISNLRDVPQYFNAQNIASVEGRGAYKWRNKWRATINRKHLGMFATKEEAHAAWLREKMATHPGYVHNKGMQ